MSRKLSRGDEVFRTVKKTAKIKKSAYGAGGVFPIIDQGVERTAGFTDDADLLMPGAPPYILFGDHTCVLKWIDQPFVAGADGTQVLKPVDSVDARYLYYALHTIPLKVKGYERHFKYLKEGLVPTPPLRDQHRIAGILSAYDDLIAVNERRIAVLEEMARRVFERWFSYPNAERDGWSFLTLGEWVTEVKEKSNPKEMATSMPYVGLEHIPRRSTTLNGWGTLNGVISTKSRFQAGDILFGKIRPYFHKVVHAPIDGVSSTDAIVVRPNDPDHMPVVLGLMSSDSFVDHATQTSNGTKMPRANWEVLQEVPLPHPPEPELTRYCQSVRPMVELCDSLARQNANLRTTRDLLLPRLISGEINVSEVPAPTAVAAE